MKQTEVRVTLRLPADLAAQVRRLADREARSLNGELVYAIRLYVESRAQDKGSRREDKDV